MLYILTFTQKVNKKMWDLFKLEKSCNNSSPVKEGFFVTFPTRADFLFASMTEVNFEGLPWPQKKTLSGNS